MNTIEYWDNRAFDFDNHIAKFSKVYTRIIDLFEKSLTPNARVLDIATGTGKIPIRIAPKVHSIEAVDFSPKMIEIARENAQMRGVKNINFTVSNGETLRFEFASFDVVIINNLLHLVENPNLILSEAYRVLKPGGLLLTATLLHGVNFKTRFLSHVFKMLNHPVSHRFNQNTLLKLIGSNSFRVKEFELIRNIIPSLYINSYKLNS